MKGKTGFITAVVFILLTLLDITTLVGLPPGKCAICHEEEDGTYKCWVLQDKGGDSCTVNNNGTECHTNGVCP